jgi:hypothetical protein
MAGLKKDWRVPLEDWRVPPRTGWLVCRRVGRFLKRVGGSWRVPRRIGGLLRKTAVFPAGVL